MTDEDLREVAFAICKSRTCEGVNCCQWPSNRGRTRCPVKSGCYDDAAESAIAAMHRIAAQVRAETVEEAISAIGKKATELEIIQCCDHGVPSRDGTAECCGSPDLMLSESDAQTAIRALLNKENG